MKNLVLITLFISLAVFAGFSPCPAQSAKLPETLPEGADLQTTSSPDQSLQMFYLFQPPKQALFGIAKPDGEILWQKQVGFRPLVEYFWGTEGNSVVFVTDCNQPESELKIAGESTTRSYFFVLDALQGKVLAEGDLDTDVLNLPQELPDAMGASHDLQLSLSKETLSVTINHLGREISGSRPLKELSPPQ